MIDARSWEKSYNLWVQDPIKIEKPGPHPDKNHAWNTQPEIFAIPPSNHDRDTDDHDDDEDGQ